MDTGGWPGRAPGTAGSGVRAPDVYSLCGSLRLAGCLLEAGPEAPAAFIAAARGVMSLADTAGALRALARPHCREGAVP